VTSHNQFTSREDHNFDAYPAFRMLFPNQVIPADDLARCMVDVAIRGAGERESVVFENRDIRAMAQSLHFS